MGVLEKRILEIQKKKLLIKENKIRQLKYQSIGSTGWLLKSEDKVYFNEKKKSFDVDLPKLSNTIISYKEYSDNLEEYPKTTDVDVVRQRDIEVNFSGETHGNINCVLVVSEYSFKQVLHHEIQLNEIKKFTLGKNTNLRFSIKLSGYGELLLNEITIGETNLWSTNKINKKEGYDWIHEKNWLIPINDHIAYDKEVNAFLVNSYFNSMIYYGDDVNKLYPIKTLLNDGDDSVYVNFIGNKDISVDANLIIALYLKNGTEKRFKVPFNNNLIIDVPQDAVNYSLNLEMKGDGLVIIDKIILSSYNFWPHLYNLKYKEENLSIERPSRKLLLTKNTLLNWFHHTPKLTFNKWKSAFISDLDKNQTINLKVKKTKDLDLKLNKLYNLYPTARTTNNIKLTFIIVTKNFKKEKQVHHIPFNQNCRLKLPLEITEIEYYLKIEGKGSFKDGVIGCDEKELPITNRVQVSLEDNDWFNLSKDIKLRCEDGNLVGDVRLNEDKRYISYREMNNSFSLGPENNIMLIKQGHNYIFNIKGTYDNGMQVIPMVIGYNDYQKIELQQLKLNGKNSIKFHPSVNKIRLTIRTTGVGQFEISDFNILESPDFQQDTTPVYTNRFEVEQYNLIMPKKVKDIKLAAIFDEFTEASFKPECNLIQFGPSDWRETLVREQPDLLMVESAWKGNGGAWTKKVGDYGIENNEELFELVEWCKSNDIPTVFWNKEDPVHFERFINIAAKFDLVLTTDENIIWKYRERLGHANVFPLPFAAQPLIHNPIKIYKDRIGKVCFAGSYYHHHKERSEDMNALLGAAAEYGLDIFDRNYNKTKDGLMPNHQFPDRFKPYIKGNLKYYEIGKAYKGYKVNMNVNTVKFSNTMFSRRVFESLACGTPIVSNYSDGIKRMFNDLVFCSDDETELNKYFEKLFNNENFYNKVSHLGLREVLTNHTYKTRLQFILRKVGRKVESELPLITVVAFVTSEKELDTIIKSFNRQRYSNKKLKVFTDAFIGYLEYFKKYNNENVNIFLKDYVVNNYPNIKEMINEGFISYFSKDNFYGENYLSDLELATRYTTAEFVGKNHYYSIEDKEEVKENNPNKNFEFTTILYPSRCMIKVDSLETISIKTLFEKFQNDLKLDGFFSLGYRLFSCDKYNFIQNITRLNEKAKLDIIKHIEI